MKEITQLREELITYFCHLLPKGISITYDEKEIDSLIGEHLKIIQMQAKDSDNFERHFQERVAHIVIKNKEAHIDLVNLCNYHHHKRPNSMYIDFEQSLNSYKASQNAH